eukprot:2906037-Pyramimonas_sp.AAC.1
MGAGVGELGAAACSPRAGRSGAESAGLPHCPPGRPAPSPASWPWWRGHLAPPRGWHARSEALPHEEKPRHSFRRP